MLLINGPLMINRPKTKKGLEYFEGHSVELLYGTKDSSYKYSEILQVVQSDKLCISEADGIDHTFSDGYEQLHLAVELFLTKVMQ